MPYEEQRKGQRERKRRAKRYLQEGEINSQRQTRINEKHTWGIYKSAFSSLVTVSREEGGGEEKGEGSKSKEGGGSKAGGWRLGLLCSE